ERLARSGEAWAQRQVGVMLRMGSGIDQDDEEAVSWFQLAVKNGEAFAETDLAFHYQYGRGVPKDILAAVRHLLSAARTFDTSWLRNSFSAALGEANKEEAKRIREMRDPALNDPSLLDVEGCLPELCLSAVTSYSELRDNAAALQLLAGMIET